MAATDRPATRRWASSALVICGGAILAYGLLLHGAVVSPQAKDPNGVTSTQLEPALIREVSIGGLARDGEGLLRKTYSGNKAPKACPT
jgi:hypothetical protein